MGTKNIKFAVTNEDLPLLEELVEYFGDGDRSVYLRATLRVMASVKRVQEQGLAQAYDQGNPVAEGLAIIEHAIADAHREADEIRSQALQEADGLLAAAQDPRTDNELGSRMLQLAQQTAGQAVDDARREADEIRRQAHMEAEQLRRRVR